MGKTDAKIDQYIARSADFAKPILFHFRDLVHKASPDVEEQMKWSFPHFVYKGILCSMASFQSHCAIGFWKSSLVLGNAIKKDAMGQLGRIRSLDDLPSDKVLLGYIKKAVQLNEEGVKVTRVPPKPRPRLGAAPDDLLTALKKNRKAQATFESFSPSHKREYIEWITDAKTEATRKKRLSNAIEWMAEGKSRNWKYVR
jgi:uncharacterized protein YdeI (YjbR/CyaY-like superfamily)